MRETGCRMDHPGTDHPRCTTREEHAAMPPFLWFDLAGALAGAALPAVARATLALAALSLYAALVARIRQGTW